MYRKYIFHFHLPFTTMKTETNKFQMFSWFSAIQSIRCSLCHCSRNQISDKMVILGKLWKFQSDWKNKTPKQKWNILYQFIRFMGDFIQVRVLSTCEVGLIGYIPALCAVLHLILAIYTIFYYCSIGSLSECLRTFCVSGIVASVRWKKHLKCVFLNINYTFHIHLSDLCSIFHRYKWVSIRLEKVTFNTWRIYLSRWLSRQCL